MQGPRPFLVRMFNEGNPFYHVLELVMWATGFGMANRYTRQLFNRRDFCPLQKTQFLMVTEATAEDQERCQEKTFYGTRKAGYDKLAESPRPWVRTAR